MTTKNAVYINKNGKTVYADKRTDKTLLLAEEIQNNLQSKERADGETFVCWKDEAPAHLKEWFTKVSGEYTDHNFSELDEVYEVLSALCGLIQDNDNEDMEQAIYDNQWSYDYNSMLLDWVDKSLFRAEDVNEAIANGATELFPAIQMAMDSTRSQMALSFYNSLVELAQ